ncbi:MAG TPA: hypothetical protein VHO25_04110, partial [Polyangiaceae bacterium]|nr:hypothetical protein [Polyangiaceae bacterium]
MGMVDEFLRWAADHGVGADQLEAYRVCADQLLRQAGRKPVDATHVEAARKALQAAGVKVQTVAQVRNVADALRHFQREAGIVPAAASARRVSSAPVRAMEPQAPQGEERQVFRLRPGYILGGYVALLVAVVAGYFAVRGSGDEETRAEKPKARVAARAKADKDEEPSAEEAEVRRVYAEFHEAMRAGDRARLQQVMAAEKMAELGGDAGAPQLELAKQMYPETATILKVAIDDTTAQLTAKANMGDMFAKGTIDLVKEDAAWKVKNAAWTLTNEPIEEEKPKRDVPRPTELPQLAGTWQGAEVGGGISWTLTFKGHRVEAVSAAGESYAGEALIRWDLGVEQDSIPVPPGWTPLDIEIDQASHDQAVGKVALAAFSRHDDELKLCGGPPGYRKRVKSFEMPGSNFRCMILNRTSAAAPEMAASAQPQVAAAKDVGPGEATLLLDGVAQRYQLKVGFFSDTKMADPTRAMMHFENPAEPHSNARRILLTLDATQTGRHFADGKAIHDSMFNEGPVNVGELVDGARAAVFKWQADGGQIYPPKMGTRCAINVVSPYTGESDSLFIAEISECLVHSAGIDRQIRNAKLRI